MTKKLVEAHDKDGPYDDWCAEVPRAARTRPQQRVLLVCDVWHPDAAAAGLRAAASAACSAAPSQ